MLDASENVVASAVKPFFCIVCESEVAAWIPFRDGELSPVCVVLEAIGSDVRNFSCPNCGAHDRERHLFLYLQRLELWPTSRESVLHFAAESHLGPIVRSHSSSYVDVDYSPVREETLRVDIRSIQFPDESFDVVIANHVLEHIDRDDVALSEIYRVLRPGGRAVLQTPFSPLLEISLENSSIQSEEMRLFFFDQEDHVRFYGLDLFQRMTNAGFTVERIEHAQALPDIDSRRFGVNEREPLILARKPK